MGTIAQKLQKLLETKEAIRAAIAGKGQSVADNDPFSSYPAKIAAIRTGSDTSDATATASDILSGKTAYVKGAKVTGNIASKGAADLTASGAAVSVPAGYYPSAVSKSVPAATQATPGISVSSGGLITASATQTAGYVAAGTKSATKQLTTQAAATVTPGTAAKTAVASGRYTTGAVKVAGDANLVAGNIRSGVSIFGVTGSAQTVTTCTITLNAVTDRTIYYTGLDGLKSFTSKAGSSYTLQVVYGGVVVLSGNANGTYGGVSPVFNAGAQATDEESGCYCLFYCTGNGKISM